MRQFTDTLFVQSRGLQVRVDTISDFKSALRHLLETYLNEAYTTWARPLGHDKNLGRWLAGTVPRRKAWSDFLVSFRKAGPTNETRESDIAAAERMLKLARAKPRHVAADFNYGHADPCLIDSPASPNLFETVDEQKGAPRVTTLTPVAPKDTSRNERAWESLTSTPMHRVLNDREWAWAAEPFSEGLGTGKIRLLYADSDPRYDEQLAPLAKDALRRWCATDPESAKLEAEPWGQQVRVTTASFNHEQYTYDIRLAPVTFLYYLAIHQNLWKPELRALRAAMFENATTGLDKGERSLLPSTFAIHMGVVSSDGKALLRRRRSEQSTRLYSRAWEAGIGEFMHGPTRKTTFAHFNRGANPSIRLFLRNAVKEELDYAKARSKDFKIYGFAVEWRTLAPKLIVVYSSDLPIDSLMRGARAAKDGAREVCACDLTVDGVARMLLDARYRPWGPTSKLTLLLALLQHSKDENIIQNLGAEMQRVQGASRQA